MRDYCLFSFILITSCSGPSAKDPITSCNSAWIWFFCMSWSPWKKANKSTIGHQDAYLWLLLFFIEKRDTFAYSTVQPAWRLIGSDVSDWKWWFKFVLMRGLKRSHLRSLHSSTRKYFNVKTISPSLCYILRNPALQVHNRFLSKYKWEKVKERKDHNSKAFQILVLDNLVIIRFLRKKK